MIRRGVSIFVESVTWLLFAIATFLLARQTWFAVQGQQPDYSSIEAAFIVAGIVTATWIVMLIRLVLQIDKTPIDWFISLSLLVASIAIDIAVGFAVIFEWAFPVHLALFVIVAHVLAHVTQWIVAAAQQARQRFSGQYQSPEDKVEAAQREVVRLSTQLASSEQARSMLEQTVSRLEAQIEQMKSAEALRREGFKWICPDCGADFKHSSEDSLARAKRTHLNQRCPKLKERQRNSNGYRHERTEA